jgi:hypothetical protein
VTLEISASDSSENAITGPATVTAKAYYVDSLNTVRREISKEINLGKSPTELELNYEKDFNLNFLLKDMKLIFEVTVDKYSSYPESRSVIVHVSGKYLIKISKRKILNPDYPIHIFASVSDLEGIPLIDSTNYLTLKCAWKLNNGQQQHKSVVKPIKGRSAADFIVEPMKDAATLTLTFEYLNNKVSETIKFDKNMFNQEMIQADILQSNE